MPVARAVVGGDRRRGKKAGETLYNGMTELEFRLQPGFSPSGVVTDGGLKGNVLEGDYKRFICPHDRPTPFYFDGTFVIKKGSKNND